MGEQRRKERIVGIFDRAAPTYDRTGLEFFGPPGRRLVALAGLRPGERVLDLGCGRGASLFPAAEAVGPTGEVVGVDLAPAMLAQTADEARRRGLTWVRLRSGDAEHPDEPEGSFDAVIAGFVVFFLDDPAAAVARWGRLLRPGGRLVLSTFSPPTEAEKAMWTAIEEAVKPYQPVVEAPAGGGADPRIFEAEWLAALFEGSGLVDVETVEMAQRTEYPSPDRVWDFLLSAAGRPLIENIPAEHEAAAREALAAAAVPHLRQPDGGLARVTGMRLTRAYRPATSH